VASAAASPRRSRTPSGRTSSRCSSPARGRSSASVSTRARCETACGSAGSSAPRA